MLTFNIAIECDLTLSAQSDKIAHTIDYMGVMEVVAQAAREGSWSLLEKLGQDLVTVLFQQFERAQIIEIELRKRVTPQAGYVSVGLRRERTGA